VEIRGAYMSSNGEMKISLKLIIYGVSASKLDSRFYFSLDGNTNVFVAEMLEKLQLPVGSLGQNRGAERLHDFLDRNRLRCQLISSRTIEWPDERCLI
jgi:hypothetical protein